MRTQFYGEKKHLESGGWNCTKKYWESVQEDSEKASHCFSRHHYSWALYYGYSWALYHYYSWALFVLASHEEAGWDWDRVSSGDGSHVTVRLQLLLLLLLPYIPDCKPQLGEPVAKDSKAPAGKTARYLLMLFN